MPRWGMQLRKALKDLADPVLAEKARRFFKTGKGEYSEGDRFIGIRVPVIRQQVLLFRDTPRADLLRLLHSHWHEERLAALLLLVDKFQRGDKQEQQDSYALYLDNTAHINNWDLVDCSAHPIVGAHLLSRSRRPLYRLARSCSLWERRIAIVATWHFIRRRDLEDTLTIAELLLEDPEDLIHKAVGWMLRELGKRDMELLKDFLTNHYARLPRTTLRYAIEKFPERERQRFLRGNL
jgi:3-methyladenine DNA glycosylase AlkD